MTEAEWLACQDPTPMLEFLRANRKLSRRKARLFACACCRRVHRQEWGDGPHPAILVSERFADGLLGKRQLRLAKWKVAGVGSYSSVTSASNAVAAAAEKEAATAASAAAAHAADYFGYLGWERAGWARGAGLDTFTAGREAEWKVQAALLRDVFGNPFRPLAPLEPRLLTWNGGLVVKLAQAAYDDRLLVCGGLDPARLSVLADALEEVGCDNDEVLRHLRQQGGVHVRGCWVLDLLLKKG